MASNNLTQIGSARGLSTQARMTSSGARGHRGSAPRSRWGAAVVELPPKQAREGGDPLVWKEVRVRRRAGRQTTTWVGSQPIPATPAFGRARDWPTDAQPRTACHSKNRIRRAFELFGSCMLIASFLAVAILA